MKFIDYYLKNKDEFPELEFYEVKYSGDSTGYSTSSDMKYLKRDMIIMLPKSCNIFKEYLKDIKNFEIYAYFKTEFFYKIRNKKLYENAFTINDKILVPIKYFTSLSEGIIPLNEHKDVSDLLKLINNFLIKTGLDKKYFSILDRTPEESFSWHIQLKNFTSIEKVRHPRYLNSKRKNIKIVFKN